MLGRAVRRVSALLFAAALSMSLCASAFAAGSTVSCTLQSGGTVYGLCQQSGIDYYSNLDAILSLNGFTREEQLSKMPVGAKVVLPAADGAVAKPQLISGDTVAYYVMPFLFEEGDTICGVYWLWGLRFETYADVIRSINSKNNLDYIWVGELLYLPTDAANLMGSDYTTVIAHPMKVGETAYDVCKSYDMEYDKVSDKLALYNPGQDLTKLGSGQTLYIPLL